MPPRQAKKANKVIEIVALTGKPVKFQFTGGALEGNKVDIEYTEVACEHLLGCTQIHDGSALDITHLTKCIPRGLAMLNEQTSEPELRVRYTDHDKKLYIRAALTEGKWRLELPAE
jgi:hypothetical protein